MGAIRMRTLRDGKKVYDAEVKRRGHRRLSRTFERLVDARAWVQDVESGMRQGRNMERAEAPRHTLNEAIDRYISEELPKKPKSYRQQHAQLLWYKEQLGHKLLSEITPAVLSECKSAFLKTPTCRGAVRSRPTWNRYQSILSCLFQICCGEWQWMDYNPARRLRREREKPGRVRFLSDDERQRLLNACRRSDAPNLYVTVVLTLSTGMRKNEVRYLKWEDVDLKQGAIILQETKNRERRRVPVRDLALELLREHAKVRMLDSNYVFPGPMTRRTGQPWELRGPWEAAVKAAGIEDFHFHDLRHSCASYLAMGGASLLEIAEVLGHKTLQMVKRYSHLAESHTASVVERMNKRIFGRE